MEPQWWTPPRRGRSRAPLEREAIVAAAFRVLDQDGLRGLTMRRVASELDTGAASLYWHIADREQLLQLVVDRVLGEVELPEPDPTRWAEQIKEVAFATHEAFRRHRDVAQATLGRVPMGPNLVRLVEWMLDVLDAAGIPDQEAAWFPDLFGLIIGAQALDDHLAETADPREQAAMQAYVEGLPEDRYPHLRRAAESLMGGAQRNRFEFAVDLLVRGLSTYAKR